MNDLDLIALARLWRKRAKELGSHSGAFFYLSCASDLMKVLKSSPMYDEQPPSQPETSIALSSEHYYVREAPEQSEGPAPPEEASSHTCGGGCEAHNHESLPDATGDSSEYGESGDGS